MSEEQVPQANQSPAPQSMTQIEDLDGFAAVITQWHHIVMQRLHHLTQVPDGIEFTVGDGEPEKLTGDLRKGFMLGIEMATSEIQKLPFQSFTEEPEFVAQEGSASNDELSPN